MKRRKYTQQMSINRKPVNKGEKTENNEINE